MGWWQTLKTNSDEMGYGFVKWEIFTTRGTKRPCVLGAIIVFLVVKLMCLFHHKGHKGSTRGTKSHSVLSVIFVSLVVKLAGLFSPQGAQRKHKVHKES